MGESRDRFQLADGFGVRVEGEYPRQLFVTVLPRNEEVARMAAVMSRDAGPEFVPDAGGPVLAALAMTAVLLAGVCDLAGLLPGPWQAAAGVASGLLVAALTVHVLRTNGRVRRCERAATERVSAVARSRDLARSAWVEELVRSMNSRRSGSIGSVRNVSGVPR